MNKNGQQVWIVTGSSSGLGAAISDVLTKACGFHVEKWDLDNGMDVTKAEDVYMFMDAYVEHGVKIDGIVNCAGIAKLAWFKDITQEDYDAVFDVNCRSIFNMVQSAIFNGVFDYRPTVVNVISTASRLPMTNSFTYCASKAAAEMMTRQMARELIKTHGITVFGIAPNKLKKTGMTDQIDERVQELRGWSAEEAKGYQEAGNGNLEYTDPNSVAAVLGFMLSKPEFHKFQNGAIIPMGV